MGLIGGMARTAVVAGTATAVGNRVSRRQANRWAQKDQSAYDDQYAQQQYAQPQYAQPVYAQPQYAQPQYAPPQYAQPAPPAPAPAASGTDDMLHQLRQLAELKDQGILTEAEFTAQKARILGT
jgi:Short C-terminal domain